MRGANVVPALQPSGYLRLIAASRPAAEQTIARQIDEGRFAELSNSLVLPPVDDLRQAAFFLPYALLRTNADSALAAKEAYGELLARLKALDGAAIAAAHYQAEEVEVAAALGAFLSALDGVVAAASGQRAPAASA
ncbi:hypothetical protein WJX81_007449 [Elliptochloris bilobata]|uniref:Uncharacterized protein n=1 Tax=Elliptochloris bilobata TaxID=381761 RepID=A0AAW1R2N3_9CHLO